MAWNVNVNKSERETLSHATGMIQERFGTRSSKKTNSVAHVGYDVVGINAQSVPEMRRRINEYVELIYSEIDKINTNVSSKTAFRGDELNEAVSNYLTTVKEYCVNLTSQLLAFSDKLADVQKAWQAAVGSMSQQVGSSANSFSKGTKYKEEL